MNDNNTSFDFQEAEKKIKELQTYKQALSYEISKNQVLADELRNRVDFESAKIEERKQLKDRMLKEIEGKIAESEDLNKSLRLLRIEYEQVKNDIEAQRRMLDSDRSTLSLEKASFSERSELREETLAKRELEVENKEKSIKHKLMEADARLEEIFKREEKVAALQENLQSSLAQVELDKKTADFNKVEAQKLMDEATSTKSIVDSKMSDVNKHMDDLIGRERALKTDIEYHETAKKKFKQDERELILEKNRLQQLRFKLKGEIENSSIESKLKKEMLDEVKEQNENTL